MDKIQAKPISKSFWILQQNNRKIGQVLKTHNGYDVNINGNEGRFKHKKDLDMIEFIKPVTYSKELFEVHTFPTDGIAYNAVWNLKYKLPLYTLDACSKSWHAAGYYEINIKGKKVIEFCPKLITLQRNSYSGPFKTKPIPMFDKLFK